jgi:mannose-1-phosphate guanylyltransferase
MYATELSAGGDSAIMHAPQPDWSELMTVRPATWAIVLAAGDGSRLATLTTDECGDVVPKQFCSLTGGPTLFQQAVQRAQRIVPPERVCAIVARQHERHWQHLRESLPARNMIVQPRNCGTANGVLLSVLRILERDSQARIVFLPADHYVHDEALLSESVRSAVTLLGRDRDSVTLVGIEPDTVDSDLGYIVPGEAVKFGCRRVARFVEKPSAAAARELIALGAVWNSFIFGAHASTLLALIRGRLPEIVEDMTSALARNRRALSALYERLPVLDFSRAVVQGAESVLRVSTARACGWADLGTPQRVVQTLQRLRVAPAPRVATAPVYAPRMAAFPMRASVDLAAKVAHFITATSLTAN